MKNIILFLVLISCTQAAVVLIDDFTEGVLHATVDAPDQNFSNISSGLSSVYGGQRKVTLQAQAGTGQISLSIGGGSASLSNLVNTQGFVSFEYDISGLNLGPNSFIRISGSDAISDFDAWFSVTEFGTSWSIGNQGGLYEKGGDQNSWITLSNAWFSANASTPDWSDIRTLRVYQGGGIGTLWDITRIEVMSVPEPSIALALLVSGVVFLGQRRRTK